jgi:hypothetical protein
MKVLKAISLLLILSCVYQVVQAQMPVTRDVSFANPVHQTSKPTVASSIYLKSIRIQEGKFWINGNLLPASQLPKELQHLQKEFQMMASFNEVESFEMQINGRFYIVTGNRVIPSPSNALASESSPQGRINSENNEAYWMDQCSLLSRQYHSSNSILQKNKIKSQLISAIGKWYDTSLESQEQELLEMEHEIQVLLGEIDLKRKNKEKAVSQKLYDLLNK